MTTIFRGIVYFFAAIGFILTVVIIIGLLLLRNAYNNDMYGIRTLMETGGVNIEEVQKLQQGERVDPAALINIDVEEVPQQITPAMLDCAKEVVGQERIDAFLTGSQPTLAEILKLRPCIEQ